MNPDFTKNHFELFGMPVGFQIDIAALDRTYRDVQREVHPDRFAAASDQEQRLAAQWATQVNEAYRTLKAPLSRGRYLLKLAGIDTQEESNTAMPVDFLIEQMNWREAVGDAKAAKDDVTLDKLAAQNRAAEKALIVLLEKQLSASTTFADAVISVRKLRFLEKLGEEIDLASESVSG